MAHPEQRNFIESVKAEYNEFFINKKVLEVGSLNINGSARDFFTDCDYTGIDVGLGNGVDIVAQGQEYNASDESFDTVISCECFEHNPYWLETFLNMIRMCKRGGLVFFTCATTGRQEHGTTASNPTDSPLTSEIGWEFYKNLTEENFTSVIDFKQHFKHYVFSVNNHSSDLYFYGLKQ